MNPKELLLARFVPHRTYIGLGLLAASAAAEAILGSGLCAAAAGPGTVCGIADVVINAVAPWLAIMGVADQKRGK